MTPERWALVRQIFDATLERPAAERSAYLDQACGGDADLREEIQALLSSYEESTQFLNKPVAQLDQTLISKSLFEDNTLLSQTALYAEDDPSDYQPGHRIGQFELRRRIGRGGMGAVYEAVRAEQDFNHKVAIKLVRRGMDTHEILRRFRMERQMLASLNHANIARLIDGGSTDDGIPYLVMEYVEGTPIDRYCEQNHVSITERLKLFRQVCSAVQYAHQNLIVHRDIKPGNILVTGDRTAKLLDFGIAKVLRPGLSPGDSQQTQIYMRPMTIDCASPEQVRGDTITTASDIYSLGVLLYRLLTGRSPYAVAQRDFQSLREAILEGKLERPSDVVLTDDTMAVPDSTLQMRAPDAAASGESREASRKRLQRKLAGDLDNIILKARGRTPEGRYAPSDQFPEDIGRRLEGLPVVARGDKPGYRAGKFLSRHKAGVIAALAGLALLVAAAIANWEAAAEVRRTKAIVEQQSALSREYARGTVAGLATQPDPDAAIRYALDYLDRLVRVSEGNIALRRGIVDDYLRIGDLQRARGNGAEARNTYEKALALADSSNQGSVQQRLGR